MSKGAQNNERFSGLWGHHNLLLWLANINNPETVKLCRKGPKLVGNLWILTLNIGESIGTTGEQFPVVADMVTGFGFRRYVYKQR